MHITKTVSHFFEKIKIQISQLWNLIETAFLLACPTHTSGSLNQVSGGSTLHLVVSWSFWGSVLYPKFSISTLRVDKDLKFFQVFLNMPVYWPVICLFSSIVWLVMPWFVWWSYGLSSQSVGHPKLSISVLKLDRDLGFTQENHT